MRKTSSSLIGMVSEPFLGTLTLPIVPECQGTHSVIKLLCIKKLLRITLQSLATFDFVD